MDWNSAYIAERIAQALAEDVGAGDVTVAATIPAKCDGKGAHYRKAGDGLRRTAPGEKRISDARSAKWTLQARVSDGQLVKEGQELLHLSGQAAAILPENEPR